MTTAMRCTGTTGKRADACDVEPTYVDRRGRLWCHVHADRTGCLQPPREALPGIVAMRRALQPAGGTCTDAELAALGAWARPRGDRTAWAAHVRRLLAESPGRDLASAAIEARGVVERRPELAKVANRVHVTCRVF